MWVRWSRESSASSRPDQGKGAAPLEEAHRKEEERQFGVSENEVRHEPAASQRRLRWYVAALLITPFVVVALSLVWMSTDFYARHSDNSYFHQLGYGETQHGVRCDVLISGDSTAMVGVDPAEIQRRTGLSTCNIAEYAGIQLLTGTQILDDFLRNNPRPKYLIFLEAPENYSNSHDWKFVGTLEGVVFRLRTPPASATFRLIATHPLEIIENAEVGLLSGVRSLLKKSPSSADVHSRESHGGQFPDKGKIRTDCGGKPPLMKPDLTWMKSLRQTYGQEGTRVLLDVTPMPPCDPSWDFYRSAFSSGALDMPLSTMPLEVYSNSGRLHTMPRGAEMISARLADQILTLEREAR